jgi:ABC-2 type transport system permease protein
MEGIDTTRWPTWAAEWWLDLALYRRLVGARVRSQMQYRTSFALMTLVSLTATGTDLLAILILFDQFRELAGWRVGEVALLAAIGRLPGWPNSLRRLMSSRPASARRFRPDAPAAGRRLPQVLSADFQMRRLGRVTQGVVALTLAAVLTPIAWTRKLYLPVAIVSGAVCSARG